MQILFIRYIPNKQLLFNKFLYIQFRLIRKLGKKTILEMVKLANKKRPIYIGL